MAANVRRGVEQLVRVSGIDQSEVSFTRQMTLMTNENKLLHFKRLY